MSCSCDHSKQTSPPSYVFSSWGGGSEVFNFFLPKVSQLFHQQNNYDKMSIFEIASKRRIFTLHPCQGSVTENFQPWVPLQEHGVFLWLKTF